MKVTNSMVISACLQQNTALLESYKNSGVDFNKIRDENGDSLLHLAILYDKYITFSTLINLGMDLHIHSKYDGTSPLTFAILYGQDYFVKKLIEKGVDINRLDGEGWTPLLTAILVEEESPQLIKLLLANPNIDVNIPFNEFPPHIFFR